MQSLAPYLNPAVGLNTTADIKTLVRGKLPCKVGFTARLLDQNLKPLAVPNPKYPGDPSNVSNFIEPPPKVIHNTAQDAHRTCDFVFREDPTFQLDLLSTNIQVFRTYRSLDLQTVIMDVPRGIFGFQVPQRTLSDAGNILTVTGYDSTYGLSRIQFQSPYVIPAGFNLITAIEIMLMADKLPPSKGGRQPASNPYVWPDANNPGLCPNGCDFYGFNAPASRIALDHDATLVTPIALAFDRKMAGLHAAINQMLDIASYAHIWQDSFGVLRAGLSPYARSTPLPEWTYKAGYGSSDPDSDMVLDNIVAQITNQAALYNLVQAVSENTLFPPMEVILTNRSNPAYSPYGGNSLISIDRVGVWAAPMLQNDKITDLPTLTTFALSKLTEYAAGAESLQVSTFGQPFLENLDSISLNVKNAQSGVVEVESTYFPFIISQFTENLDPANWTTQMTIGRDVAL